jgi:hypothetical protein
MLVREPISYYSTNNFLNTQPIFRIIISMVTIVAIMNIEKIASMNTIFINVAILVIVNIKGIVKIATILIISIFSTIVTIVEIYIHCITVVVE